MSRAPTSSAVQLAFAEDAEMQAKVAATPRFADVDAAEYDAVLFAGGHGAMWDFPEDPEIARVAQEIYEAGGVVAAVGHGAAALLGVTLADGRPLLAGKQVSAFTNSEETAAGLSEVVPFLLQSRLEESGAVDAGGENFQSQVVIDGRLVTGQNAMSAKGVAQAVLAVLTS
jgi:putative intracellular protease/amidase